MMIEDEGVEKTNIKQQKRNKDGQLGRLVKYFIACRLDLPVEN